MWTGGSPDHWIGDLVFIDNEPLVRFHLDDPSIRFDALANSLQYMV